MNEAAFPPSPLGMVAGDLPLLNLRASSAPRASFPSPPPGAAPAPGAPFLTGGFTLLDRHSSKVCLPWTPPLLTPGAPLLSRRLH